MRTSKQIKRAKKRPYARGGRIHNGAGVSAIFLIVCALAFLRWQMDEWLISTLALLFLLLIYLAKRYEERRNIKSVDKMSGHEFERYLVEVFDASGYRTRLVGDCGADFGADLLVAKGAKSYAVQAKNYDLSVHKVGNDAVQQAIAGASYYNCDEAIVITNAEFTRAAKEQANHSHIIPVTLMSRKELIQMIKKL